MGIVRMGVPEDIALFIKNNFGVDCFIETGTYLGGTATWAAKHFKKVYTIELSKKLFDQTSGRFGHIDNIQFNFGDTRVELKKILENSGESLVWLDAHWCGEASYGENDQCPLLEELDILVNEKNNHFILIDDARLFIAPPPSPNIAAQYPDLKSIILKLSAKNKKIYIYEDVMICVPEFAVEAMDSYLQGRTTADWNNYTKQLMKEKETKENNKNGRGQSLMEKLKLKRRQ